MLHSALSVVNSGVADLIKPSAFKHQKEKQEPGACWQSVYDAGTAAVSDEHELCYQMNDKSFICPLICYQEWYWYDNIY